MEHSAGNKRRWWRVRRAVIQLIAMTLCAGSAWWLAQSRTSLGAAAAVAAGFGAGLYLLLLLWNLYQMQLHAYHEQQRRFEQLSLSNHEAMAIRIRRLKALGISCVVLSVGCIVLLVIGCNSRRGEGLLFGGAIGFFVFISLAIAFLVKAERRQSALTRVRTLTRLELAPVEIAREGDVFLDFRLVALAEDELLMQRDRTLRHQRAWRWVSLIGGPLIGSLLVVAGAYGIAGSSSVKAVMAGVAVGIIAPVLALLPFSMQWGAGARVAAGRPGFIFERAHLFLRTRYRVVEWTPDCRLNLVLPHGKQKSVIVLLERPHKPAIHLAHSDTASPQSESDGYRLCELVHSVLGHRAEDAEV